MKASVDDSVESPTDTHNCDIRLSTMREDSMMLLTPKRDTEQPNGDVAHRPAGSRPMQVAAITPFHAAPADTRHDQLLTVAHDCAATLRAILDEVHAQMTTAANGKLPPHWDLIIWRMEMMSLTFFLSVIAADLFMLFFVRDFY